MQKARDVENVFTRVTTDSSFSSFRTSRCRTYSRRFECWQSWKTCHRFETDRGEIRMAIYLLDSRETDIPDVLSACVYRRVCRTSRRYQSRTSLAKEIYRFSIYGIRDSWRTRGEIFYLAIAAARAGRAFRFRGKSAGDRIAARIELVTLLDRSAIALFPVVDHPVSARRPYHHLSTGGRPEDKRNAFTFFLRNNAIVEISLRRNEPRWESSTRFHWNRGEKVSRCESLRRLVICFCTLVKRTILPLRDGSFRRKLGLRSISLN